MKREEEFSFFYRFFSVFIHDFNNVLNIIIGKTYLVRMMIKKDLLDKEKIFAHLDSVDHSSNKEITMIEGLSKLGEVFLERKSSFTSVSLSSALDVFFISSFAKTGIIYSFENKIEDDELIFSDVDFLFNLFSAFIILFEIRHKSLFKNNLILKVESISKASLSLCSNSNFLEEAKEGELFLNMKKIFKNVECEMTGEEVIIKVCIEKNNYTEA